MFSPALMCCLISEWWILGKTWRNVLKLEKSIKAKDGTLELLDIGVIINTLEHYSRKNCFPEKLNVAVHLSTPSDRAAWTNQGVSKTRSECSVPVPCSLLYLPGQERSWKCGKPLKVSVKSFQGNCSAESAACPQGGNRRETTYSVVGEGAQI